MPILGCTRCGVRREVPGWPGREACACGGLLTLAVGATLELPPELPDRNALLARAGLLGLPAGAPALEGTIDDGAVLPLPGRGVVDPDRTTDESRILPLPGQIASPATGATYEDARVIELPAARPASQESTRPRSGAFARPPSQRNPFESVRPPSGAYPRPPSHVGPAPSGSFRRPASTVGPPAEASQAAEPDATFKDEVVLVPPRPATGRFGPPLGATQEDARVMPIPDESRQASAVAPPPKRTAHEVPVIEPVVLPAPALRIGGYELREAIGHGGFAAVYRAWDPKHEREVALKVLERLDPKARARFQRELLATARLRHPNIVGLLDSGKDERGRPFLVLELVRGSTLAEAWRGPCRTAADVAGRVRAIKELARALEHSHASGVLHRDVKPENVLLDEGGRARLIDLGLARIGGGEALTQEGDAYGTPAYMSPEQAGSGDVVDGRSDVYSLGATLYRGLTGQPPFEGSGLELFLAIFREEPAAPETLAANITPELSAICMRCLEKDPARRYGTMGELGDELERWLAGAPLVTRTPGRADRLRRGLERQLAPIAAATIGLLLGVVGSQILLALLPVETQVAAARPTRKDPVDPPPVVSVGQEEPTEADGAFQFDPSGAPIDTGALALNGMKVQLPRLAERGDPIPAPPVVAPTPPPPVEPVEAEPPPARRVAPAPPAEPGPFESALLPVGLGAVLAVLALVAARAALRRQHRATAMVALARWQAGRLGTEATEVAEGPAS